MTFNEMAKEKRRAMLKQGKSVGLRDAKLLIAKQVLEGYQDSEDAREEARTLKRTGGVRYTAEGWEIGPATILSALKFVQEQ